MYDLIIIGAGPAGLTAALYAGRFRLKTLLLEGMSLGGRILMSESIENFPGFPGGVSTHELIKRMEEQVRELEVKIELDQVLDIDCAGKSIKTNSGSYSSKSMIIATGARPKKLGVPGEDILTGRGVSYCATCDGPLFKDKNVIVIGGGDTVAEEALYLSRIARSVNIIHRRPQLRASLILQERMKANNKINFILDSVVTEIAGSTRVESVKIKNVNTSAEQNIACDGVFVYIGYHPDTEFAKDKLKLDEAGFIVTEENMAASCEGIFACGDCRKKTLYQVITACADGAVAADSAFKYLERNK